MKRDFLRTFKGEYMYLCRAIAWSKPVVASIRQKYILPIIRSKDNNAHESCTVTQIGINDSGALRGYVDFSMFCL